MNGKEYKEYREFVKSNRKRNEEYALKQLEKNGCYIPVKKRKIIESEPVNVQQDQSNIEGFIENSTENNAN